MRVFICYNCFYDYRETFETAVKAFDTIEKADAWVKAFEATETQWRTFKGMDLE